MRRAEWTPALPEGAARWIIVILSLQSIVRGTDYLLGDRDDVTTSLSIAEQAMPLQAWGAIFTLGGIAVLVGVARKTPRAIMSGAGWLVGAYGALAWSLFLKMVDKATPWADFWDHLTNPHWAWSWVSDTIAAFPLDGWRTPTAFVTAALIWGAIGWGTMIKAKAWEVSRGSNSRADPS